MKNGKIEFSAAELAAMHIALHNYCVMLNELLDDDDDDDDTQTRFELGFAREAQKKVTLLYNRFGKAFPPLE